MIRIVKIGILLVVVITGYWLINRSGSKAKINYSTTAKNPQAIVDKKQHKQGKYLGFDFWPGYELRDNLTESKDAEGFLLLGPSGNSEQWTINLSPGSKLAENSGVIMRRVKNDLYQEESFHKGWIFSKRDSVEMVYLEDGPSGLLSVAVTANTNDDRLKHKFEEFVTGIIRKE